MRRGTALSVPFECFVTASCARLGLVHAPPPLLTLEEWAAAEHKARGRNDSALPCPICKEQFRHDDQVLTCSPCAAAAAHPLQVILSCSHVFHEACIRSFERFSGIKACPLCRSRDYQKKRTWTGKELFRQKSVLLLQRALRCARARRRLRHLQDTVVPKDAAKRQEFWAKRLCKLTDALLMQVSPHPRRSHAPVCHMMLTP